MSIKPSVGNLSDLAGKRVVVVDIDGTIVDSSERGKSVAHIDRDKLGRYSEADRMQMYARIPDDPVYPCVSDYLRSLRSDGVKIVYLTARDDLALALTLKHFRKNQIPVDAVFFEPEEYLGKSRDWKRSALSELSLNCEILNFFDDHLPHVEDARELGIHSTHVTHPDKLWCALMRQTEDII